jgi:hypothetical protein
MDSKPQTGFDIKHLTNCPICEEELKTYIPYFSFILDYTYCPPCDIVKMTFMSGPYLCEECHSESFYQRDGNDFCFMCNSDSVRSFSYDEFEKLERQGELKQGFRAFERVEMPKKEHSPNILESIIDLRRIHHEVFESVCANSGESVYIKIPEISQLENNWMGEEIPIGEYIRMLQRSPVKVITFTDADDLVEKIKDTVDDILEEKIKDTIDESLEDNYHILEDED